MTWLRTRSRSDRPHRTAVRPAVEELEGRTTPTATPLNVANALAHGDEYYNDFVTRQMMTILHHPPSPTSLAAWRAQLEHGLLTETFQAKLAANPQTLSLYGGANAAWVTSLFREFLGRDPSPAGVTARVNALQAGASPLEIALGITTGTEHLTDEIRDAFRSVLGRLPGANEVTGFLSWLRQEHDVPDMVAALAGTKEFFARSGGTNADFVTRLFDAVLDRTPTLGELDGWRVALGDILSPPITPTTGVTQLLTLNVNPLDINLLGLEVQTSDIEVTVSAQPGDGKLLGNVLAAAGNLINFQGASKALNTVLDNVVSLLNTSALNVTGVDTTGTLGTPTSGDTQVLDLFVAPVHVDLLGALVDTSPIHLTITAHTGDGLVLGNAVSALAHLFDPPLPSQLTLDDINAKLQDLLNQLNAAIPGIGSAPVTTPTLPPGSDQVLALTVAPLDVNLLGLVLKTTQIQVNANAETGSGQLLGNVLTTLLNTLGATPDNLQTLNNNLNAVLAKVVGVLNASTLTLPPGALDTLSQVLQTLALPDLVNTTGTPATAPVLNLVIASPDGTTPPVNVDLLGLNITTSNINAELLAQTGDGQVLGNLVYNVAHLLDPDGGAGLLALLNTLSV